MTKEEAREAIKEAYGTSEYTDEIIKVLSVEPQGFEDYLKQYLGENDQMIIGKDVYEELKYEAGEAKKEYKKALAKNKALYEALYDELDTFEESIEQAEWVSIKDGLPEEDCECWVTLGYGTNRVIDSLRYCATKQGFHNQRSLELRGYRIVAWQKKICARTI